MVAAIPATIDSARGEWYGSGLPKGSIAQLAYNHIPMRRFAHFVFALVAPAALALVAAPVGAASGGSVLIVGDSISTAYGIPGGQGWVALLEARLAAERYPQRVINASISGDTTAGGRSRLPGLLAQHQPAVVVIELGGNDALRGGTLDATRANLDAMVTAAQAAGAKVLILGMKLPPNYGARYAREFDAVFADVAKARKASLVPYLFDGFGEKLELFQPDRIHPTVEAQPLILANAWPALRPLLGGRK